VKVYNAVHLQPTSRSRAAVARRAHNPKVGSSILPFATEASKEAFFSSNNAAYVMFTVYVLYSVGFEKIYIGYSSNLNERLKSHNELAQKG
jgi:lysylphosphatidylglycerol synthetase-like protein (DUF2156 family)